MTTEQDSNKDNNPSPKTPVHGKLVNVSGGANLEAQQIEVGGDVVGRDKIIGGDEVRGDKEVIEVAPGGVVVAKGGLLANIHLPRSMQIAIGIVAVAIVVLVVKAVMPASARINTEILFDASAAMADPERWRIAQTVFGDQATYATRREQLALRKVGGGCDVPREPLVPLGTDQADRLVSAVKGLTPAGDAALVDSIKAAADDLPADADAQNTIILVSAGEDTCLTQQQKDPCAAMAAVAQSLERAGIKFTLHIVALRADEAALQQLTCLARANATGYVYQANSVDDLKDVLSQIDNHVTPTLTADSWPLAHTLEIPRNPWNLAWSPDGKQVLVNTDLEVLAWDLASNQVVTVSVDGSPQSGVWSPDGKLMASFGGVGAIIVEGNSSKVVLTTDVPGGMVSGAYSLAWSPDGQHLAAGSLDGTVPIWDLASKTSRRLPGHTGAIFEVAWSPDGKQVASGGTDGTVRLWDAASGQPLQVLKEDGSQVAWSPDSRQLASAAYGRNTVRIWDAAAGQMVATITTENNINSMRWSPDGAYIARGFEIIDARRQKSLGGLFDSDGSSLAWSPDGTQLAIGSVRPETNGGHYVIRVWQVPPASR